MFYPIQLDKMRNFKYGMKAISTLEKKLKKPIGQIDMSDLTMEDSATLIWAGLVHEDKDLTPDRVMDLIDDHSDIATALNAMGEAFQGAFGAKNEELPAGVKQRSIDLLNGKIEGDETKNE